MKKLIYNKRNRNVTKSRPFDAQIKQLKRESLILVSLVKAKPFAKECFDRGIKIGVGDVYNDGVIIYKD